MAICPKASISSCYGILDDDPECRLFVFITGCKAWTCPACGPIKEQRFFRRCIEARPNRFMTLTTVQLPALQKDGTRSLDDEWETWDEVHRRSTRQIAELFRWFKRDGLKAEYVRVIEECESGRPHYHFLMRGPYWDQKIISQRWSHLSGAYVVDIRSTKKGEADITDYVCKYLRKQDRVSFTKQRISRSRSFFRTQQKQKMPVTWMPDSWQRYDEPWENVVEQISEQCRFREIRYEAIYVVEDRDVGDELPFELTREHQFWTPSDKTAFTN